jgi:hypothetical protein
MYDHVSLVSGWTHVIWWVCVSQGYGKFLISLAYCLSHLEQKPGTAERPLSDLGAVSFRSYWTRQVLDALRDCKGEVTVQVRNKHSACAWWW